MTPPESSAAPWHVLNPGGRDSAVDYCGGPGVPSGSVHPPVNYHAYAACTGGGFHRDFASLPPDALNVMVLLRKRNLRLALRCVTSIRQRGANAWVSLKESGAFQAGELIGDPVRWRDFSAVCQQANGCLSSTPDLVAIYRAAGAVRTEFVPTPYPTDLAEWDFSRQPCERSGIFIGTRDFRVPSRRHFAALAIAVPIARDLGVPVVVINADGRSGAKVLRAFGSGLTVVDGPLRYPDYLRLMAASRVVWQLDRSRVPGQVAGDALLCGLPCIGGDGAVDRIGHPLSHGDGRSDAELAEILSRALTDSAFYGDIAGSSRTAGSQIDFSKTSAVLRALG